MYSDTSHTTSCSDCKLEEIKQRWTQILLNWLNKCVHPQATVTKLNHRSLIEIVNKYKTDICVNEVERTFLSSDDVEPFVRYRYPILRLKNFCDDRDYYRKQYILTSVLLFHFCISSVEGRVDSDICGNLDKCEQELILKFCERLGDMEVTTNNVEVAVIDAFESVKTVRSKRKTHTRERQKITPIIAPELTDPSDSTLKPSLSDASKRIKFKSSVTVLPTAMMETSSVSDIDYVIYNSKPDLAERKDFVTQSASSDYNGGCMPDCSCSSCSPPAPCCGDPGSSMVNCWQEADAVPTEDDNDVKKPQSIWARYKWIIAAAISSLILLAIIISLLTIYIVQEEEEYIAINDKEKARHKRLEEKAEARDKTFELDKKEMRMLQPNTFTCKQNICQKVYEPTPGAYLSWSRCVLHCMGPQIWPYPIGNTSYSKEIIAVSTSNFEYKFQTVPSEAVSSYLAEAFKLFIGDLARLERVNKVDSEVDNVTSFDVKKMYIQIDVELDPEPRLKVNTDESYTLSINATDNNVTIKIMSPSFCGVRHGLETLSQLILFDQTTGYLITLSKVNIKDTPSYKYRGLMIDTAKNYISVPDLMRTIDAMSTCKLNTFHWRISDVTSFPLLLTKLPQLFENGGYRRDLVYTKDDVKAIVKRASVRGIRVLLEVAVPGPVGRAWSWNKVASCPSRTSSSSCSNILCLRLSIKESVMDILQTIYAEIMEITQVDDIFHLSNGLFSMLNCYYLLEDKEGFLEKALERLKLANKGFLPKLPIVWYTADLAKDYEAKVWDRLGVQLTEWLQNPGNHNLSRFKVIHSSRWDLSCEVKKMRCRKCRTWQDMYSWKSWRNIESYTTEGGEALLWTDLVDTGNLDYHLWPRVAAVAERLWSDVSIKGSVEPAVYVRLDSHRWRMLMKSVDIRPIWPMYCSFNPGICLQKLDTRTNK